MEAAPVAVLDTVTAHEVPKREGVLVTHRNPDQDALMSTWMIKRHLPGWQNAQVVFVNAGTRDNGVSDSQVIDTPGDYTRAKVQKPEEPNRDYLYLDTGFSALDHHQPGFADRNTCATSLAFGYVRQQNPELEGIPISMALQQMVEYATAEDHFRHINRWNAETIEGHYFTLYSVLRSMKKDYIGDSVYAEQAMKVLDAVKHSLVGQEVNTNSANLAVQKWVETKSQNGTLDAGSQRVANYMRNPLSDSDQFSLKHILNGLASILSAEEFDVFSRQLLDSMGDTITSDILPAEEALKAGVVFDTDKGKGILLHTLSKTAEVLASISGFPIVIQYGDSFQGGTKKHARIGLRNQDAEGTLLDPTFNLARVKELVWQTESTRPSFILSEDKPNYTDVWFFHPNGALATNSDEHKRRIPTSITEEEMVKILQQAFASPDSRGPK